MASNAWDYEQTAPPLNDTRVDRLEANAQGGQIDALATLSIDIPDQKIIQNLNQRIEDARGYWDASDGFNLRVVRGDNVRQYWNKAKDVRSLYRFQMPYQENQIYISQQAIKAYLTAQQPQSEVSPAQDSPISKQFALDLEKIHMAHSYKVNTAALFETCVHNCMNKRVGMIKFEYDPDLDEIIPKAIDPEHVIVDKNARMGENPAFVCQFLQMSINEMCHRWPNKKQEIYEQAAKQAGWGGEQGKMRGTYNQLEAIFVVNEVYLTYYDKAYEPHEALVYYFGACVLEKTKNPHWLYASPKKNFLSAPKKPWIYLNFDNDGSHLIDQTSATEQAGYIQNVLDKRGRQLMEVADKANGMLIVSTASGLTLDQLQELTGDPNQKLLIQVEPGKSVQDSVFQVPPPEVSQVLYQDKLDLRMTIANIMGVPSDFSGVDDSNNEDTLGQSMLKKNQAAGRQDLYVRCIDRFANDYFNMLTQMMVVWYDKEHFFVYNGGDGEFDYLVCSRYLFEDGIAVSVKSGSTPPLDKQREEAIALNLAKEGALSPLDIYKMLHLQNPQKLYDNMAKWKADPNSLARDTLDSMEDSKAFMDFIKIMNGLKPEPPDDCKKEYVLSLRKLMLRDEFLKAKKKYQNYFLDFVNKAITSLELRTSLDIMSGEGLQLLEPRVPFQPLPPPMPPQQPGMMGAMSPMMGQPPGQPGTPPPGQPGSMPPLQQAQGVPVGAPPVQNGTPLQNPNNPVVPPPTNPTALPTL
jgi:hypothetical protein